MKREPLSAAAAGVHTDRAFVGLACVGFACISFGTRPAHADVSGLTQAIVGGHEVHEPSPVMLLRGPTGLCSSTLVAKRLVLTARHCVAQLANGPFSCTPQGETRLNGTSGGRMGEDWRAEELSFFVAERAAHALDPDLVPDAVGARILSTGTRTACRDDLAFVVLDRDILGVTPAALRLEKGTRPGERVSVSGYGLTGMVEPTTLHERNDVEVLGVGAAVPSEFAGLAPVRSVRISSVTCAGDSGGAIFSQATSAVVALVSMGGWDQQQANDPYGPCVVDELSAASGPRIGAYPALVKQAFEAANEAPTLEIEVATPDVDAGVEPTPTPESRSPQGCAIGRSETSSRDWLFSWMGLSVAGLLSAARRERRRHGR